jgi:hypothetical protein
MGVPSNWLRGEEVDIGEETGLANYIEVLLSSSAI